MSLLSLALCETYGAQTLSHLVDLVATAAAAAQHLEPGRFVGWVEKMIVLLMS